MFIALEGIDGSGKTTVANCVEASLNKMLPDIECFKKSSTHVRELYVSRQLELMQRLVWPRDDGRQHALLGDHYWLHLVVAWFSLVTEARFSEPVTSKFCDHWYYRFIAKFVVKGYPEDWLFQLFAHVRKPDLVILLDIDPEIAWDRRLQFKRQEMGSLDGFTTVGRESYLLYQQKVREVLLSYAQKMNWCVINQMPAMDSAQTAERVIKMIGEANAASRTNVPTG